MNDNIQVLIPLFVALPLAVSLLIQLVARGRPVVAEWLANATMLLLVLVTCYAIERSGLYHLGGWLARSTTCSTTRCSNHCCSSMPVPWNTPPARVN